MLTGSVNEKEINSIESSIEAVNNALIDVRPDNEFSDTNPFIISDGIEKEINDL